jgi:tyrosinase
MGDLVARLLSYNFETYGAFVSTKYHLKDKVAGSNFLSLELIHNNVHVFSGGYESGSTGHMADIAVAAFDPIFWLHHR